MTSTTTYIILWYLVYFYGPLAIAQRLDPSIDINTLTSIEFAGKWTNQNPQILNQYGFLSNQQGEFHCYFTQNTSGVKTLTMYIMDTPYYENKVVESIVDINDYGTSNWTAINITFKNKYYREFIERNNNQCFGEYQVVLTNDRAPKDSSGYELNITLLSESCPISLVANRMREYTFSYGQQIIYYVVFISLICLVKYATSLKLGILLQTEPNQAKRVKQIKNIQYSLITVGYVTILDCYVCLQNLFFSLQYTNQNFYFLIPAICYFFLSNYVEMKLMWIIWKSQNADLEFNQLRKQIVLFQMKFCNALDLCQDFSLLLYFVLVYYFQYTLWFSTLNSLFLIPQIFANCYQGRSPDFEANYLFGFALTNILQIYYFRGCPANFRSLEPSNMILLIWSCSISFQVFVLALQYRFGGRWMIPRIFLPKPFNYHKIKDLQNFLNEECPICIERVVEAENQLLASLHMELMRTPCNHIYHSSCLKAWLRVNNNCPLCKSVIPLDEDGGQ